MSAPRAKCLVAAAALLGCAEPRDRVLPMPLTLRGPAQAGVFLAQAQVGEPGVCDPTAPFQRPPLRAMVDLATPLSAYRPQSAGSESAQDRQVPLWLDDGDSGGGAFHPKVLLCDNTVLRVLGAPTWELGLAPHTSPVDMVLGGDLLRRYSVLLSQTDDQQSLRLLPSEFVNNCQLHERGVAVMTFQPQGGNLFVQLGTDVVTYPPSRVILAACLEPYRHPSGACGDGGDPGFQPSGVDARLLLSTALPTTVLSTSLFQRLRGQPPSGTTRQLVVPGLGAITGNAETLGRGEAAALALVSRERYLGPCAELSRSRRQRHSLPLREGPTGTQEDPACLQDLGQTCAYSGPNNDLACRDSSSPVAAVLELQDAVDVLVVADEAPLLQGPNADLHAGSSNVPAQIDGILGLSVLRRLEAEVDTPGGRFIARCRCSRPASECLTFPRDTYDDADSCSAAPELRLSARGPTTCS